MIKLGSCEKRKMTQQKLGAMVGVSYRTIQSWEVEGRYPKQSSLYQKLADAFQCQVAALFASGTMTNEDKTIFMDGMTRLYLESKKNRRKW